jgi:predicted nucleic acid-binding protein
VDVDAVGLALEHRQAVLPPVVLSELLSDPEHPRAVKPLFVGLSMLPLSDRYWERAGLLRAKVLARGRKAPLADTRIAQSCLEHDIELVTRNADFRHFAAAVALKLFAGGPRRGSPRSLPCS